MKKVLRLQLVALMAVAASLFATQGCASVGEYFTYRYNDFTETVELGLTLTDTPQFGMYANCFDLLPLGYSKIDGRFAGFGAGQIGVIRHYNHCWGYGYGEETIGWGTSLDDPDPKKRDEVLIKRRAGLIGHVFGLAGEDPGVREFCSGPDYAPECIHFLPHLGYVGLAWNIRYVQLADFLLGWFGLDIAGDDGYPVGKWSFPRRWD